MSSSTAVAPAAKAARIEGRVFSMNWCGGESIIAAVQVSFVSPARGKV